MKGKEDRDRESLRYRQTGGGGSGGGKGGERDRDTYFTVYPNLNDSSEEQYKAKETDIRPEADGSGRSTGVARMGDGSRGGRAETGGPGWAGDGIVACPY